MNFLNLTKEFFSREKTLQKISAVQERLSGRQSRPCKAMATVSMQFQTKVTCFRQKQISCLHKSVNSTNAYLQENIGSGIKDGYTVLAHRQTNGKGRIGRSFFSPPDTGVYMSLLLRPENYSAEQAMQITTIASVAACEAIETVSEHTASIKWVNDVYIGKKKSAVFSQKHPLRWKISFLTTQFWESVSTLILRKKDFHPSLTTLFVLSLKSESPMEKTG